MVISVAVAGVISNCSIVPTSFSLIIVAAETTEPLLTSRIPIVPVTMNHEFTSPGLNRRAMRLSMLPWPTFCSVMFIATGTAVFSGDGPLWPSEVLGARASWAGNGPRARGDGASWGGGDDLVAEVAGATAG